MQEPNLPTETFVLPKGTMEMIADFIMSQPAVQILHRLQQVIPVGPVEPVPEKEPSND